MQKYKAKQGKCVLIVTEISLKSDRLHTLISKLNKAGWNLGSGHDSKEVKKIGKNYHVTLIPYIGAPTQSIIFKPTSETALNLFESFSDTKEYRKYFNDAIKELKDKAKPPVVNSHLHKHLRQIINTTIARQYRKAAMEILIKSSQDIVSEFLYYHHSDSDNVACLVIDKARAILVKKRKIKASKNNWNK